MAESGSEFPAYPEASAPSVLAAGLTSPLAKGSTRSPKGKPDYESWESNFKSNLMAPGTL